MSGKVTYKQRDIVLTKLPFSNLMDYKVRPVLVLSKDSYNRKYADVIVCAITNIEQAIILKKIGKVKQAVFSKVLSRLNCLFTE